ncbi:MAG TPA: oligosaccharide flippase family protein [Myxococcales bacterium]|nr:oligosaccharide flippase family protein [Myxococcales bacterium]
MNSRTIVSRNALLMLVSQLLTNGLSFITVPLLARWLGSTDYGTMYLAGVVAGFGAMAIECGQDNYSVLAIARDNSRAAEFIASSAVLRLLLGVVGALVLEVALRLLGYDSLTRLLVFMVYISQLLASVGTAAMAVVKGLEKMAFNAWMRVFTEVLHTGLLVGAIALGWRMRGICGAEIVTYAGTLLVCARVVIRMRLLPARPRLATMLELLKGGVPFFLWTSIVALQPSVEAVLLSKFGSPEAVGWFGASAKILNLLVFPAVILGSALSPTLARLHATDAEAFGRAVRGALRVTVFIAFPLSVGSFLFADAGMNLVFGGGAFAPSADNLRVFSAYLLPVSLNITLGTAILASGRQLAWTLWKGALVAVGAGASALLISWFQARTGNGGLGAAAVTAAAEFAMLGAAVHLLGRGVLDRTIYADLLRAIAASAAMIVPVRGFPAAPFPVLFVAASVAYVGTLAALGGVGIRDVTILRSTFLARSGRQSPIP